MGERERERERLGERQSLRGRTPCTVLHYVPVIIPIFLFFSSLLLTCFSSKTTPPLDITLHPSCSLALYLSLVLSICASEYAHTPRWCLVLFAFYITGPCVNFQGHSVLPSPPGRPSIMCTPPLPLPQSYLQNNTVEKKVKVQHTE